MKTYLLGIDIGTSACKVAVFTPEGKVVADGNGSYPVYYPKEGWAEQDPNDWWEAVCATTKGLLQKEEIDPRSIVGVGLDGQGWSAIAVDKEGKSLCNTPIWMDTRSQEICKELNERIGEDKLFALSGNVLRPSYTTGKVLWYQKHLPEVFGKTEKILHSNAWIAFRLTGAFSQDICQAYGYHCFDMRKGQWDDAVCKELGIEKRLLPEVVACHEVVGKVSKEAAAQIGLCEGTPVVAGGLDAACGALGAGVVKSGEIQEQGGQAGGMSICMDRYVANPALILGYHVVPNLWLLQGGTTGGGGVMNWLEREFAQYERTQAKTLSLSSFAQLDKQAEAVPIGSEGLVFLPYMAGERSPIWDPHAKGVYYGLDFSKTKAHLVRASMEGVAYALKHNLDVAEEAGAQIGELRAMGGASNSCFWTQMKADISGKTIVVPRSDTATTLGAAILAGVGVGVYAGFEQAVEQTVSITRKHEPSEEAHRQYQDNYKTYLELYENLRHLMKKQAE